MREKACTQTEQPTVNLDQPLELPGHGICAEKNNRQVARGGLRWPHYQYHEQTNVKLCLSL